MYFKFVSKEGVYIRNNICYGIMCDLVNISFCSLTKYTSKNRTVQIKLYTDWLLVNYAEWSDCLYALFVFFVVVVVVVSVVVCVLPHKKHIKAFSAQVMQAGVCGIWNMILTHTESSCSYSRIIAIKIDVVKTCFSYYVRMRRLVLTKQMPKTIMHNMPRRRIQKELMRFSRTSLWLKISCSSRKHTYIILTPLNPTFI